MSTESTRSFGTLLRQYRRAAGLTQEELAERARLSWQAVSDLERGVNARPRRDTIELLIEALALVGPERAAFEAAAHRPRPSSEATHPNPDRAATIEQGAATPSAALPGGMLTFLIADVRGYTAYTHQYGDEAAISLARRIGGLAYTDRGPLELKGLSRPVHTWLVHAAPIGETAADAQDMAATHAPPGAAVEAWLGGQRPSPSPLASLRVELACGIPGTPMAYWEELQAEDAGAFQGYWMALQARIGARNKRTEGGMEDLGGWVAFPHERSPITGGHGRVRGVCILLECTNGHH